MVVSQLYVVKNGSSTRGRTTLNLCTLLSKNYSQLCLPLLCPHLRLELLAFLTFEPVAREDATLARTGIAQVISPEPACLHPRGGGLASLAGVLAFEISIAKAFAMGIPQAGG